MPRQPGYGALCAIVYGGIASIALIAAPVRAGSPLIWAFGDSLTAGYGLLPANGFPAKLEQALRKSGVAATVRNGGIAGDTAAQGRARLAWGLRGLGAKPDLVIVELGANDMLRGLPAAAAEQNLDLILGDLKHRQIPVLVVGMKAAPNLGEDYRRSFEGMYPRLARRYGDPLYPFFLDGVAANPKLLQADGRHPNPLGVDIIVARILPAVRGALRR